MPWAGHGAQWQTLLAAVIFISSYAVFALGKLPGLRIDRPGMAMIGAVAMFAIGVLTPRTAIEDINFSTLVLLFAMMVIVAHLHQAGFFEWIAATVERRITPPRLLPVLIFTSGILSAIFVNDIICICLAPLVLLLCRRLRLRPVPYLLALATASNIGSVATLTGNPQNMLIASYAGIAYRTYLVRLAPVALAGLLLDWAILRWIYGPAPELQCAGAAEAPAPGAGARPDRAALRITGVVMGGVMAGFLIGFPPALVAAIGAAILLLSSRLDPRQVYADVDWGLLVFFAGLFLIVGGAEQAGLIARLMRFAGHWNLQRPAWFTLLTAGLSNLVNNVPAVMLLKDLAAKFTQPQTGWLLLAMASTLAGNFTITGSVANMIVIEQARGKAEISLREYMRVGVPLTALTLLMGWLWLR